MFAIWAFIAADLTAKIPLAGYSYQWISRINGPTWAWFTGFIALMGWVCGMTGVGFILSGYLGGLFGWSMRQSAQILLAIVVVFRLRADQHLRCPVRHHGQQHRGQPGTGRSRSERPLLVAIIAFSAPENHQPISVLFTGGESGDKDSYLLAWLAAALGPFFGLIGVESGADVAEETKNARYVVPKTMFYALVTSIVIELLMYIVFVLAIRDAGAVEANSAAPIEEIINQQAGPVVTKIVVAVALTNILACLLANILVATRLTYSMARDNMLPFSHVWRHVSAKTKTPTYAVIGLGCLSTSCCCRRSSTRRRSTTSSASRHCCSSSSTSCRRSGCSSAPQGHDPAGRARHLRPRPVAVTALRHSLVVFLAVAVALLFLPQFTSNKWVFLGVLAVAAALVGHRPAVAVAPRRGRVRTTPRPT